MCFFKAGVWSFENVLVFTEYASLRNLRTDVMTTCRDKLGCLLHCSIVSSILARNFGSRVSELTKACWWSLSIWQHERGCYWTMVWYAVEYLLRVDSSTDNVDFFSLCREGKYALCMQDYNLFFLLLLITIEPEVWEFLGYYAASSGSTSPYFGRAYLCHIRELKVQQENFSS